MFRINDVYDEITKQQVIKRIDVIDLTHDGSDGVSWQAGSSADLVTGKRDFYVKATFSKGYPIKSYNTGEMPNIVIPGYTTTECKNIRETNRDDCTIYLNNLFIHDSEAQNINKFRSSIAGRKLYYELPEPIITDLNPTIFIEFIATSEPILEPIYNDTNPHANYHAKVKHDKRKNGNS